MYLNYVTKNRYIFYLISPVIKHLKFNSVCVFIFTLHSRCAVFGLEFNGWNID